MRPVLGSSSPKNLSSPAGESKTKQEVNADGNITITRHSKIKIMPEIRVKCCKIMLDQISKA